MAIGTVQDLVDVLRTHQLLPPERLNELTVTVIGRVDDPKRLGKYLVQRHWLTLFQLQAIFQGLGAELALGPYRILDRLGKGGVSSVFKAWDTIAKRNVALKVIHPDLESNEEAFGRLQREMMAATRLNHPNIVKALDVDLKGRRHYFAMEYVEGIDLQKMVQLSGKLPVADACTYIRQAALGLQHAYEIGLVHRDIKPANLLLIEDKRLIKILDLGLARLQFTMKHEVNLTVEGSLIGSADYLAPEQSRNPSAVDVRADIYSLGCTLFFLLAGEVPFPGGSAFLKIHRHLNEEPKPSLEERNPEVPDPLVLICKKMMAKNPDERYRTPAAVAAALAPYAIQTHGDLNLAAPTGSDSDGLSGRLPLTTESGKITLPRDGDSGFLRVPMDIRFDDLDPKKAR